MTQKFAVCVETKNGNAYLEAHGRVEWSKRVAQKHMQDYITTNELKAWLEEA